MPEPTYDVLVVGGGPGGYTTAIRAAQLGFATALVERDRLGGICLNWGCVPTKALLKNAELLETLRRAGEWGITAENVRFDFARIIQRSRAAADRLSKGVEFLMKKNKIAVFSGFARLAGQGRVEIRSEGKSDQLVSARHVILATGARPRTLPGIAIDRKKVISSTEAMTLAEQPRSMVIIGAGAIGIEFAYFYNALRTKVTVVEMMPGILPVEDRELTRELERSLRKQGIEILTESKVEKIRADGEGVTVTVKAADGATKETGGDVALMAIGVQGNVENIGLEEAGVAVERGQIKVDADYRTSATGIYAIGDVIGPPWLAHVASAEGIHCVEALAGLHPAPLDYSAIPGCTYCQPQVASIGLTEEKAKASGREIKVGKFPFTANGRARAMGSMEGFVKLLADSGEQVDDGTVLAEITAICEYVEAALFGARRAYSEVTPGLPLISAKAIENVIVNDRNLSGLGVKADDILDLSFLQKLQQERNSKR